MLSLSLCLNIHTKWSLYPTAEVAESPKRWKSWLNPFQPHYLIWKRKQYECNHLEVKHQETLQFPTFWASSIQFVQNRKLQPDKHLISFTVSTTPLFWQNSDTKVRNQHLCPTMSGLFSKTQSPTYTVPCLLPKGHHILPLAHGFNPGAEKIDHHPYMSYQEDHYPFQWRSLWLYGDVWDQGFSHRFLIHLHLQQISPQSLWILMTPGGCKASSHLCHHLCHQRVRCTNWSKIPKEHRIAVQYMPMRNSSKSYTIAFLE